MFPVPLGGCCISLLRDLAQLRSEEEIDNISKTGQWDRSRARSRGATKGDYMLHTVVFYIPEGKNKSSAPNIFHVVAPICSYYKISVSIKYADAC